VVFESGVAQLLTLVVGRRGAGHQSTPAAGQVFNSGSASGDDTPSLGPNGLLLWGIGL
jgi:hypothetical protein